MGIGWVDRLVSGKCGTEGVRCIGADRLVRGVFREEGARRGRGREGSFGGGVLAFVCVNDCG